MFYLCFKVGYPQPDVGVCCLFASLSSMGILHTYRVYWGKLSPLLGGKAGKFLQHNTKCGKRTYFIYFVILTYHMKNKR